MAKATCAIAGCDRDELARTMCGLHYQRLRNTGSVLLRPEPALQERFWAKVDKTDTCWLWTGYVMPSGYGFWSYGPKRAPVKTSAHRFSYELANGPIPDGLHIDHLCSVRACVNPAHLEAVTQQENNRRTRRSHCKRGHEMTEANIYVTPSSGHRQCGLCMQMHNRRLL